jgi:hypothetical protein
MRGRERVYILLGAHVAARVPAGNDCGHALVARMRLLVKARTCWARTRANGRGRVGPGADSSRDRECRRTCVGRGLVGKGTDYKRGCVGPNADSSHVHDCGRTRVVRKHRLMGTGG